MITQKKYVLRDNLRPTP